MNTVPRRSSEEAQTSRCAVEYALDVMSGKWKVLILYQLMSEGVLRFNQLRQRLPGVTQRMLTKQLREMETEGLISRLVYAEVPPRVEYRLTAQGEELRPVVDLLREWGIRRGAEGGITLRCP